MRRENLRDAHPGRRFNLGIGVHEGEPEPRSEPPSNRRFAGAHHAHKHDRAPPERRHDRRLRLRRRIHLEHGGIGMNAVSEVLRPAARSGAPSYTPEREALASCART